MTYQWAHWRYEPSSKQWRFWLNGQPVFKAYRGPDGALIFNKSDTISRAMTEILTRLAIGLFEQNDAVPKRIRCDHLEALEREIDKFQRLAEGRE